MLTRLIKSVVHAHIRVRQGKAENVKTYTDKRTKKLTPDTEVKYKRTGIDTYKRMGILIKETPKSYIVQPKRSETGDKGPIKIDKIKDEIVSLAAHMKKIKAVKPVSEKIDTQGDRAAAHYNLKNSEHTLRKEIIKQRGIEEDKIVTHPSFIGPAILITSTQASKNNIPTTMSSKKTAAFWNQAENEDYKEMLSLYAVGAMKAWRRELSKPLDVQVKNNIKEFKEVLAGKKRSSYTHYVMETEGRNAVISYLKERAELRDKTHDMDIHDMVEDPYARRLAEEKVATQPMQLKYTLAANHETLADDTQKMLAGMTPTEREALKIKFGFHPYKNEEGKRTATNDDVAAQLNKLGHKNGTWRWDRNSVGAMMSGLMEKMKASPRLADLSWHQDEKLGRPVWKSIEESEEPVSRIPKDLHPEGLFKANDVEYEITHDGEEAVLKSGDFRDLFRAAREQMLVKSAMEELEDYLQGEQP